MQVQRITLTSLVIVLVIGILAWLPATRSLNAWLSGSQGAACEARGGKCYTTVRNGTSGYCQKTATMTENVPCQKTVSIKCAKNQTPPCTKQVTGKCPKQTTKTIPVNMHKVGKCDGNGYACFACPSGSTWTTQ